MYSGSRPLHPLPEYLYVAPLTLFALVFPSLCPPVHAMAARPLSHDTTSSFASRHNEEILGAEPRHEGRLSEHSHREPLVVYAASRSSASVPIADEASATHDPNLVRFDGPDDREDPQNWSKMRKWFVTLICALLTVNVYVSAPSLYRMIVVDHSSTGHLHRLRLLLLRS